jgi:hypothetical protein
VALSCGLGLFGLASCVGVEADVLSLRPTEDMAAPDEEEVPQDPPPASMSPDGGVPPSPPPPARCVFRMQGDEKTCQGKSVWRASATIDCQAQSPSQMRVEKLTFSGICGHVMGGAEPWFRAIRYFCCTPSSRGSPWPHSF